MANSVEVTSTSQVVVTEVTEQVIEVQAPTAPLTVEVATVGPQGPPGPQGPAGTDGADGVTTLAALDDVDVAARVEGSVLYYDTTVSKWKGDDINTKVTLTDGGNY